MIGYFYYIYHLNGLTEWLQKTKTLCKFLSCIYLAILIRHLNALKFKHAFSLRVTISIILQREKSPILQFEKCPVSLFSILDERILCHNYGTWRTQISWLRRRGYDRPGNKQGESHAKVKGQNEELSVGIVLTRRNLRTDCGGKCLN